ncbi:MAG: 2,3-bisphosphoglycerate-independent phosphoglycerate mutase [Clostridiales Family XIII bacterium]|uniref:2,3-bisphosphoglycerate-independent phosphoglycerate mutase n=1 Tax=Hominibacterium faecale TaxID=2839743 RepID=UPI0022B2A880|nr:2,3-bisphosphoglycerate-independent phosphoglycerate mutase [Hominibacterium faecale]MDY3012082.1 2,3-bisphosphoglycerate-independent phosphoglycerate mutase [Clostridiales Family XIII bacterium]
MNSFKRPTMLMILDGFGYNKDTYGNAIAQAYTPELDKIFAKFPKTTLQACGLAVGLPEGQMGNSEVGHLNIGAGRIVYQELTRITKEIEDGVFSNNTVMNEAMEHVLKNHSALHLLGLVSDGGVHSHINHLLALIDMAVEKGVKELYVHCFLDGRDVPPCCAAAYIQQLEAHMNKVGLGKIASIAGRYYAMDRDKRWDRVNAAYDTMTLGNNLRAASADEALKVAYERDENDEFVQPTFIDHGQVVNDNDAMIMFNFRPDRAREITRAFVANEFDGFQRKKKLENLYYVCMTQYDAEMPNVHIAYPPQSLKATLGEYLSDLGLTQLRIAETEKYAHVTFFFNGGVEAPNKNEKRILIPSPKVATYDLQPEMSAYLVTEKVLEEIASDKYDVIILNFANADMVGHTGIMEATVAAIETLDKCVPQIVDAVLKKDGQILLTADHGNADNMLDENGNVVTAHSLNQVPLLHISDNPVQLRDGGKLADLAPTLLDLMGIAIPNEMTGESLIKKNKL